MTSFINDSSEFHFVSFFSAPGGYSPRHYRPILERSRRFEEPIEENSLSMTDPLLEPKKTAMVQSAAPLQCLINDNTTEKSKIISDEQVNHLNLVIQDSDGHDPVNHVVVVVPNDVNVVVVVPGNESVKTDEDSDSPQ
jgi:hypothetical protein